jgi:hypothetical protein
MKKIFLLILLSLSIVLNGHSQFGKLSPADSLYWANIKKLTQLDYQNMLDQLHIDHRPVLRKPQAPNASNSESKPRHTRIANPLILNNGDQLRRRKCGGNSDDLKSLNILTGIFIRVPKDIPADMELVSVTHDTYHVPAITKN